MSDHKGNDRPVVTSVKIKKRCSGLPPQEGDYEVEFSTSNNYADYKDHIVDSFVIHILRQTIRVTFEASVEHVHAGEKAFKCCVACNHSCLAELYDHEGNSGRIEYANGDRNYIGIEREEF